MTQNNKTKDLCQTSYFNYGAAIIPFAVDPKFHLPFFVLARNAVTKWNKHSACFTSFGGKSEKIKSHPIKTREMQIEHLEDAETTAAREFYEESLFCFNIDGIHGPLNNRTPQLVEQLRNKQYLFRIDFPVHNKIIQKTSMIPIYSVFIKQVEWNPNITDRFRTTRQKLMRVRYASCPTQSQQNFAHSHPAIQIGNRGQYTLLRRFLEKTSIEIFSIAGLRRFLQMGDHNLLADMYMRPQTKGCIKMACDLVDSAFKTHQMQKLQEYREQCILKKQSQKKQKSLKIFKKKQTEQKQTLIDHKIWTTKKMTNSQTTNNDNHDNDDNNDNDDNDNDDDNDDSVNKKFVQKDNQFITKLPAFSVHL